MRVDRKPVTRFALEFAAGVAIVMGILLVTPTETGLSSNEIVSHVALILATYVLGVLAVSIWRRWIRFGA
jgi:hypothetical protein